MKNRFLILMAIIFVIMISCDKEKEDIKSDDILFSELSSPIIASTVRDWDIEDRGVCSVDIPIPSDSLSIIDLDINNDAENDFRITLSHNYFEPTEYCGHCSVYRYDIKIQGIGVSDSIACVDQSYIPSYFCSSDTIAVDNDWTNDAILIMKNRCAMISFDIEDEFIGFKHGNQIGWIKIQSTSDNGVKIESYAINLTENRKILAGQTE